MPTNKTSAASMPAPLFTSADVEETAEVQGESITVSMALSGVSESELADCSGGPKTDAKRKQRALLLAFASLTEVPGNAVSLYRIGTTLMDSACMSRHLSNPKSQRDLKAESGVELEFRISTEKFEGKDAGARLGLVTRLGSLVSAPDFGAKAAAAIKEKAEELNVPGGFAPRVEKVQGPKPVSTVVASTISRVEKVQGPKSVSTVVASPGAKRSGDDGDTPVPKVVLDEEGNSGVMFGGIAAAVLVVFAIAYKLKFGTSHKIFASHGAANLNLSSQQKQIPASSVLGSGLHRHHRVDAVSKFEV